TNTRLNKISFVPEYNPNQYFAQVDILPAIRALRDFCFSSLTVLLCGRSPEGATPRRLSVWKAPFVDVTSEMSVLVAPGLLFLLRQLVVQNVPASFCKGRGKSGAIRI
ncbi:MAG: hypothetical protein ACLUS5_19410, partial [Roseburia faecis]